MVEERGNRSQSLDVSCRRSILAMIVGPHSGFSLQDIVRIKQEEDSRLGVFYWGYSGTHCHPQRVQDFARQTQSQDGKSPMLVMLETRVPYVSKSVGRIARVSVDGIVFDPLNDAVTLIGCTAALTCTNLRSRNTYIDLNEYAVADGARQGTPLGKYMRYQLNKACAVRTLGERSIEPRVIRVTATADLVPPYCVYLAE